MSIRFKTEIQCGMPPGASISSCSEVQVPIIDWNINPDPVQIIWQEGEPIPFDTTTVITFPELHELEEYSNYTDWRYAHEVQYGATEFFDVITAVDPFFVDFGVDRKAYFKLSWKNFHLLPPGQTQVLIKLLAHAKVGGNETVVEERFQTVYINNLTNSGDPGFPFLDKSIYNITYDTIQDTWIGDTLIKIHGAVEPVTFHVTPTAEPAGFGITPNPAINEAGINRLVNIASIYDTPGIFDYYVGWESNGTVWGTVIVRVHVTGISAGIQTNIKGSENFCLDDRFLKITRSNIAVDRMRMRLEMEFQLPNQSPITVVQTYENLFLTDDIVLYPGQEIQDFFHPLLDSYSDVTAPSPFGESELIHQPRLLFKMCKTSIILTEYDSNWLEYQTYNIGISYWLPGKKPKAWPWLTDFATRRSYSRSLISVCAVQEFFIKQNLHAIAGDQIDVSNIINADHWVVQLKFVRNAVPFNALDAIKRQGLRIEPTTEIQSSISVIYENQNLCADWFAFAGEYKNQPTLKSVMTENLSRNRKYKANVEMENVITLDTGWMFEEEIPQLWELMSAGVAFIRMSATNWLKVIPIGEKPLAYDSARNLHQSLVDFQIIKDER